MEYLYKEAGRILHLVHQRRGSPKSLCLSSSCDRKKALFAIVCQTLKCTFWACAEHVLELSLLLDHDALQTILDESGLLAQPTFEVNNSRSSMHSVLMLFVSMSSRPCSWCYFTTLC